MSGYSASRSLAWYSLYISMAIGRGRRGLQLRGSVLHMQKELHPSASCQVVLAVSEVLSEGITGDSPHNLCALHYTASLLDLAKLHALHGENGRSCWLQPFHGNNLHARKEIAMGLYKVSPPNRLQFFTVFDPQRARFIIFRYLYPTFENKEMINKEVCGCSGPHRKRTWEQRSKSSLGSG